MDADHDLPNMLFATLGGALIVLAGVALTARLHRQRAVVNHKAGGRRE
jgi:hypothetical protein